VTYEDIGPELHPYTVAALMGPFAIAQEPQTLKERLSDKASDDQRVDNCGVPLERRGTAPRPDCPTKPQTSAPVAAEGRSILRETR
jgi:hypothetical protein